MSHTVCAKVHRFSRCSRLFRHHRRPRRPPPTHSEHTPKLGCRLERHSHEGSSQEDSGQSSIYVLNIQERALTLSHSSAGQNQTRPPPKRRSPNRQQRRPQRPRPRRPTPTSRYHNLARRLLVSAASPTTAAATPCLDRTGPYRPHDQPRRRPWGTQECSEVIRRQIEPPLHLPLWSSAPNQSLSKGPRLEMGQTPRLEQVRSTVCEQGPRTPSLSWGNRPVSSAAADSLSRKRWKLRNYHLSWVRIHSKS